MKITKSQLKNVIEEVVKATIKEEETDPVQDLKNIIEGLENAQKEGTPPSGDLVLSLWDIYDRLRAGDDREAAWRDGYRKGVEAEEK